MYPSTAVPDDPDALLTKPEVQDMLSVSRTTLNRLIAAKELDVVRIGGRGRGIVRIRRRAVRDYLDRHTTRAAANAPTTRCPSCRRRTSVAYSNCVNCGAALGVRP